MARVTRGEWIALWAATLGLIAGWRIFQWGLNTGDPRYAAVRSIRSEADARRDVLVFTDEAIHLMTAARPMMSLHGIPAMDDLTGFRRLYAVGHDANALAPFLARLGTPTRRFSENAVGWDLAGLSRIVFDLGRDFLSEHVRVERVGGVHAGPCPRATGFMQCRGEPWNHLRVEPHPMGGMQVPCVFAHPQADGRLVIELDHVPAARWMVGVVGMDDRAYFAAGAPVENRIRFEPDRGAAVERTVVAPNRIGATPFRIELGGRAGRVRFTITTRNAGARQYCFAARGTE